MYVPWNRITTRTLRCLAKIRQEIVNGGVFGFCLERHWRLAGTRRGLLSSRLTRNRSRLVGVAEALLPATRPWPVREDVCNAVRRGTHELISNARGSKLRTFAVGLLMIRSPGFTNTML